MKNLILLFLCLFGLGIDANSQSTTSQISGTLADSLSKKPIHSARISLKNNSKVEIKSTISSVDGFFEIKGVAAGQYLLTINSVGYQAKTISLTINTSSKNLAIIPLSTSTTQLKGIEISGERPLIKQEIDRISYDVKNDPESKVNSVLEMMRKVPLLSLDADDNIQLQGNSNYKILINGRPSGMMERNPKDILKSMPASTIERIEVITTPPAKYDGEGLAGIINIITFKKQVNGSNGSINANHRFPVGGPGMGGSLTIKAGKLGISTNAGGSLNSTPQLNNSNLRYTDGSNPTRLAQFGTRNFDGKSGYVGTEVSYDIDSLNLISAQLNFNANSNESTSIQNSALYHDVSLLQSYELTNNLAGSGSGVDAAINYQLGFKKDKNRLLTFSYRYYRFSNNQLNDVNISNPIAYNLPNYKQNNTGGSAEKTFQIDYVYPTKKVTIETGIKAIFRDNTSNFDFLSLQSGGLFVLDPARTNGFDNKQNVFGVYNTYQFNLKKWGIKAGIRLEQTEIDANFSELTNLSSSALNLIPSISANRKFKDNSSLNFGFTSRIQRPGINQLNPFVDRSNPNFESSGNPDLRPMSGQSIEVNYSRFKKASINIGLRGMFFDNVIMPRAVTDPTTNITRSSYGNTGNATLIGLNLNVNYPFSAKLRASINGMASYGIVTGEINGSMLKTSGMMGRASSSITYKPNKTWQTTASINYSGPNFTLQGRSNTFVSSSLSLSKELFKNKVSISLAANNAFDKYRSAINTTKGPNFTQESFSQNYQRNFTTSLNYRFGKLKEEIRKNKKGINNNDVSQGSTL